MDQLAEEYKRLVEWGQSELDDDPSLQEFNAGLQAGVASHAYLPEYIPMGGLDAGYYYLDTRPGEHSGCIRYWAMEDGDATSKVKYASIAEMLATVRHSITTNTALQHQWMPTFIDDDDAQDRGALTWKIPD